MEEKTKIDQLVSNVKEYAEERLNLIVLNVHEKVSRILSGTVSTLVMIVFAVFTVLFLSLALAWWIGQEVQQPFLGFLIVGGAYLICGLLIYVNRKKWINTPVTNAFLKSVYDEEN